jgi:cytochrome c peroxidase
VHSEYSSAIDKNKRMKKVILILTVIVIALSCSRDDIVEFTQEDPTVNFSIPADFPSLNNAFNSNKPTKFGVELGENYFMRKDSVEIIRYHVPVAIILIGFFRWKNAGSGYR